MSVDTAIGIQKKITRAIGSLSLCQQSRVILFEEATELVNRAASPLRTIHSFALLLRSNTLQAPCQMRKWVFQKERKQLLCIDLRKDIFHFHLCHSASNAFGLRTSLALMPASCANRSGRQLGLASIRCVHNAEFILMSCLGIGAG